ncbi:MAG: type II toxin-antitoxin system VapC family toxin [Candidatus Heimdallarchaeota archaeon]|nr:type II toxin-antitoxin system VapC family toxin [Candidatus Heimdallarchaeota archaeon]
MFCLDSDILIAYLRGNQTAKEKITELEKQGIVHITPISAYELYFGAYLSNESAKNLQAVSALLSYFPILPFSKNEAKLAGEFSASLHKDGSPIGIRDCMIAGIAKVHNKLIITRNTRHFSRIPDLKIEKW